MKWILEECYLKNQAVHKQNIELRKAANANGKQPQYIPLVNILSQNPKQNAQVLLPPNNP